MWLGHDFEIGACLLLVQRALNFLREKKNYTHRFTHFTADKPMAQTAQAWLKTFLIPFKCTSEAQRDRKLPHFNMSVINVINYKRLVLSLNVVLWSCPVGTVPRAGCLPLRSHKIGTGSWVKSFPDISSKRMHYLLRRKDPSEFTIFSSNGLPKANQG